MRYQETSQEMGADHMGGEGLLESLARAVFPVRKHPCVVDESVDWTVGDGAHRPADRR